MKNFFLILLCLSFSGYVSAASTSKISPEEGSVPEATFRVAETGSLNDFKKKTSKVNLNAQDSEKMTLLARAALGGNLEVARYLIKKKVNLETPNRVGDTALAVAIGNMQYDVAKLLIEAGANVDIPISGETEESLLMRAATDSPKMTETIVKKNSSLVNKRNNQGETPLMVAARYGSPESLKILMNAGADPTLRNNKGQTAQEIAKESKNKNTFEFLNKRK